jgi:hypothetical protein
MVKRTGIVLGVLSLMLIMAGTSIAFGPCQGACFGGETFCAPPPMYLPVCCPEAIHKTIIKKWEVKIVGPCPPPGPPAGCGNCNALGRNDTDGLLLSLAQAIPTPFDLLGSTCDAVYGCLPANGGACGGGAPCGSCFGPLPRVLGAFGSTPFTFFGGLW